MEGGHKGHRTGCNVVTLGVGPEESDTSPFFLRTRIGDGREERPCRLRRWRRSAQGVDLRGLSSGKGRVPELRDVSRRPFWVSRVPYPFRNGIPRVRGTRVRIGVMFGIKGVDVLPRWEVSIS